MSTLKWKNFFWAGDGDWDPHASRIVNLIQFLNILFMKWSDDEELLCNHNTNSFSSSTLLTLSGLSGKNLCFPIALGVVTCVGLGCPSVRKLNGKSNTSDWLKTFYYRETINITLTD